MTVPKPYKYQKEGVRQIEAFGGRALLGDDMGLGKTAQALWWIKRNEDTLPVVIVCPANVKFMWERAALRFTNMRAEVLSGRTPMQIGGFQISRKIIIINYEILEHWLPWLMAQRPQAVVIDECQCVKNLTAKRTTHVMALCAEAPYVLGLSGTPIEKNPAELWPMLHILMPEKYQSPLKYYWKFCEPEKKPWGWVYDGASNTDLLYRILRKRCLIRRLKEDVLKDLPALTQTVVPVEIRDYPQYEHAKNDFLGWLGNISPEKAIKASRAQAIVRVGYLKRLAAKLKTTAVKEWIANFLQDTNEKLVVFTIHHKMTDVIRKKFNDTCVVLDGTVTGKHRQAAIDQFVTDKRTRITINNINAGGVGIDGYQSAACTCLFAEMGWKPNEHTQAAARLNRIGQKKPVWAYYMVGVKTIEERLCELLQERQGIVSEILDGKEGGASLDVFDQLILEMGRV